MIDKTKDVAKEAGRKVAWTGVKGLQLGVHGLSNVINGGLTGLETAGRIVDKGVVTAGRGTGWVLDKAINGVGRVVDALPLPNETKLENTINTDSSYTPKQTLGEKISNIGKGIENVNNNVVDKISGGVNTATDKIKGFADNVENKANTFTETMEESGPLAAFKKMFGHTTAAEKREIEDDALGLTEDQEDRLKELEDMQRYEHVSRKGVDFVQDKIAANEKEKEERGFRNKLLAAIGSLGSLAASGVQAGSNLFDMLKSGLSSILGGKGGLGALLKNLAVPASIWALIKSWGNYKDSEEYIESRTDANGEMVYDNTDHVIAKNVVSARNTLITKPLKFIKSKTVDPVVKVYNKIFNKKTASETAEAATNNTVKNAANTTAKTADNVVDLATYKAGKEGVESAVKETGEKTCLLYTSPSPRD